MKRNYGKAVGAISLVVFAGATYILAWSPLFEVSAIKVIGNPSGVSKESVMSASDIRVGDKLARIEPRSISNRLSEFNWIEGAEMERNWVNGEVTISLLPRTPVGIYRNRALDKSGEIFDFPGAISPDLPRVSASSPDLGLTAIELFRKLPLTIRQNLISISATSPAAIVSIETRGDRELRVRWGSLENIELKVQVYEALLALPENKRARKVDLSAPYAPIVR